MAYLIDSDVLIRAKNDFYGFDFAPGFWEWLIVKNREGVVRSIEKVANELHEIDDELSEWAAARGVEFFVPPPPSMLATLRRVSAWAEASEYERGAVATFLRGADYYLVSQALAEGDVVVTLERPSPSLKKIKIPDVCVALSVTCMTPFEMLRGERARFVLGS